MNSLNGKSKIQSKTSTSAGDSSNLFVNVLNQYIKQQEVQTITGSSSMNALDSSATNSLGSSLMDTMGSSLIGALGSSTVNSFGSSLMDTLSSTLMNSSNTSDSSGMNAYIPNLLSSILPQDTTQYAPLNTQSSSKLTFQPVQSESLNQVLGGKLTGLGDTFVQAGQRYNINPALLAAIAQHESGNGKSNAANVKNNVAGMMGQSGLKTYASVKDSIMDMAQNLSKNYLGEGLSSIAKIGAKYAPIGAGNDPTGLNNHWVTGVTKYFNQYFA